jgi:phage shock protein A
MGKEGGTCSWKGDERAGAHGSRAFDSVRISGPNFSEQLEDQSQQVELLKAALQQLESKLAESRSQAEILIARYRRARNAQRASAAAAPDSSEATFSRMGSRVAEAEGQAFASQALLHGDGVPRLEDMDKADKIERLLANLRARIAD